MTPSKMYPFVSKNLEILPSEELSFPFLDVGFLYGYGLFETIRIYNGKALLSRDHITRMQSGAIILDIDFSYEIEDMANEINALIEKNKVKDGIVNIYLTGGNREDSPYSTIFSKPLLLMVIRNYSEESVPNPFYLSVHETSFQKTPLDNLKSMSWIKNILEKKLHVDTHDILLYTQKEGILETTMSNVFFAKGDILITPTNSLILKGISRQFIIQNQQKFDVDVIEQPVFLEDLPEMDEIFLTNAVRGVIPVTEVSNFPNLSSKNVASRIKDNYFKLVEKEEENILTLQ